MFYIGKCDSIGCLHQLLGPQTQADLASHMKSGDKDHKKCHVNGLAHDVQGTIVFNSLSITMLTLQF